MSHGGFGLQDALGLLEENFDGNRYDPCPCGSGKKYKKCCGR